MEYLKKVCLTACACCAAALLVVGGWLYYLTGAIGLLWLIIGCTILVGLLVARLMSPSVFGSPEGVFPQAGVEPAMADPWLPLLEEDKKDLAQRGEAEDIMGRKAEMKSDGRKEWDNGTQMWDGGMVAEQEAILQLGHIDKAARKKRESREGIVAEEEKKNGTPRKISFEREDLRELKNGSSGSRLRFSWNGTGEFAVYDGGLHLEVVGEGAWIDKDIRETITDYSIDRLFELDIDNAEGRMICGIVPAQIAIVREDRDGGELCLKEKGNIMIG